MSADSAPGVSGGSRFGRLAQPDAFLQRAHPLSKLVAVLILTAALALSLDWVSGAVVLAALLLVYPLTGATWPLLVKRGWPLAVAVLLAGWATALTAANSGTILLHLGYTQVSTGSMTAGIAITVRGLAIALPAVMLVLSTDPSDLARGLAQNWHLPARFVMGTLAAMRLLGLMAEEWQTLSMARRARGVGSTGGVFSRMKANLGQALALLIQSVRRAGRLAVTMEARGFGSNERTFARSIRFTRRDSAVIGFAAVVAAIAVGIAVWAGAWQLLGFHL